MTTLNDIVDEVLMNLSSYGLVQPSLTTLAADIDSSVTTISVASAASISVGLIEIDSELMYVQGVDTSVNTLAVIRGYRTTAASHTAGTIVTISPPWPRKQATTAVNDAITSSYPQLYKVATTTLTADSVNNTYALPGAARILQVRELALPPITEHIRITRYHYDADLGELTINSPLRPGAEVKVTYTSGPTAIAAPTDALSTSGLQDTAKAYVVMAATAQLVIHMDAARLPVNPASADDMEQNRAVGTATQIAKVLTQRAEMELEKERKRLQQKYPATISISGRGIR